MTTTTCEAGPTAAELRLLLAAAAAASAAAVPTADRARRRADALAAVWLAPTAVAVAAYDAVLLVTGLR